MDRNREHRSLSEHLSQGVLELIRETSLRPGDRLPSVKALSSRFGVATPTMREALRLLEMAGNLDIRHGSGVFVKRVDLRLMMTNPYAGAMDAAAILNVLETRLIIEPSVAALASRNARPTHIEEMSRILAEAEAHLSGQTASDTVLGVANMRFHQAIAASAGNGVLAEVVFTLTDMHLKEQMAVLDLYNNRRRDHEQHVDILNALKRHDGAAAREMMQDHLREVADVVRGKLRASETAKKEK